MHLAFVILTRTLSYCSCFTVVEFTVDEVGPACPEEFIVRDDSDLISVKS